MSDHEPQDPYVGRSLKRVEDPRLLAGRGNFVDDIDLPGMLHAAFVRSPHPHARIVGIDVSRARALDGVAGVFTGRDLVDDIRPFVATLGRPDVRALTRRVLPLDRVRHVGEALAVVVATTRYVAEDAVDLVDVEWEALPVSIDPERTTAPGAPLLDEDAPGNVLLDFSFDSGGVTELFDDADRVFSKRLYAQRHYGAPIENDGVVADFDHRSGELTVWCTNQMPHPTRTRIAALLRIPAGDVRLICRDMGGGFGSRARTSVEEAIVPALSRRLGRPVKWIGDRYENLATGVHAKEMILDLSLAVKEGRLVAGRADLLSDVGAYSYFPSTSVYDARSAAASLPGIYEFGGISYRSRAVLTNKSWSGPYRGVGQGISQVARELLIDEIARSLDREPVEFRVANMLSGTTAHRSATGLEYDGGSYVTSLRRTQELLDYQSLRQEQKRRRETQCVEESLLGIAVLPYLEFGGWSGAMGGAHGIPSDYHDTASVAVEPDGSVLVTAGGQSHGQGHETTLAQIAADGLGARPEDVRVVQGDTAKAAWGMGTWGSRTAVISGGAILRAAADVREKLIGLAAHIFECDPDEVKFQDARAWVTGSPTDVLTLAELALAAYYGPVRIGRAESSTRRPAELDVPLVSTRSYSPPQSYSNGAMGVVVRVDTGTGTTAIDKIVIVEDCGTILNPMIVDGQITGSIAQAIGATLFEELSYGQDGGFLSRTLQDYLLPTALDMPPVCIEHLVTPSPVTEAGIKGMGEAGMVVGPAAIACAVADALSPLGVSLDRLPLDPDGVLHAIRRAGGVALPGADGVRGGE